MSDEIFTSRILRISFRFNCLTLALCSYTRFNLLIYFYRLVSGVQGITWRLGFGIDDPTQPEGK